MNINMHSSSSMPTGSMRYVMAVLGCIGVTLINFCKEDREFFPYRHVYQLSRDMIYYMAFIQIPIPVAILAERLSARRLMVVTMLTKILSLFLLRTHDPTFFGFTVFGRVLQAYADASYLPIMHLFIARWAPPNERSLIAAIIYSGIPLGEMLTNIGLYEFFYFKTIATFYCIGTLSFMWIVAWCVIMANTPEKQKDFMSEKEKKFILESLKKSETEHLHRQPPFPFKAVFTSKPFWVLAVGHCCVEGGFTLLQILPFEKGWLEISFPRGVNLTWLPNLSMMISMIMIGYIMTLKLRSQKMSLTRARRIVTFFAFVTISTPLQMICIKDEEFIFFLRIIGFMFYGSIYSGCMINHIDLSPKFAATLLSITMTLAGLVRMAVTYYFVFHFHGSQMYLDGLPHVSLLVLLFIIGVSLFCCYASAEEQSWNRDSSRCGSKKGDPAHETLLPTPV